MRYSFKRRVRIGDRWVGEGEQCFVVAEVGLNHNGDIHLAKKLVERAAECGADAVKFQKRNIDRILTTKALDAPYNAWFSYGETYGEHRRALELGDREFVELKNYAEQHDILFFASVWDEDSADFLESIRAPVFKIPSADVINLPLVEHVAKKGRPMIVSTGMSTLDEIEDAVAVISKYTDELILLHCVSTYPSEHQEINLRCMETLRATFNCPVGYSGHERGIAVSEAAAALGACLVERHFTLDRTMKGPDHAASLEPTGLLKLVRDIRTIEKSMGSPEKRILEEEMPVRAKLAKSVVAAVDIPKGTIITEKMLAVRGPSAGLPPKYVSILLGKTAAIDIPADTAITEGAVDGL